MKIIRITMEDEISIHDFPTGSYEMQNKELRKLIGDDCEIFEHVMPQRLYSELGIQTQPTNIAGQSVSMLIDESGFLKVRLKPNAVGSYLHRTDRHGHPIMGNVLFVGKEWTSDGINFCGIEESVLKRLYKEFSVMIGKAKGEVE